MMKTISLKKLYTALLLAAGATVFTGCDSNPFLDHYPQDQRTDEAYFQKPGDFKEYTNSLYGQLHGWWSPEVAYDRTMDQSTDLTAGMGQDGDLGRGSIQIPTSDSRWDKCYANIRQVNLLFANEHKYEGRHEDIEQYLGEAHFFRAYNYFYLLQFFGGVPIITIPLDTDSPELYAPRNSRYEVIDFILDDLQKACDWLPVENQIPATEKGRLSKQGAKAFKARVLLYEATWRKYVGTTTDFQGSAKPQKDQVRDFLTECIDLNWDVINSNTYSVWNHNNLQSFKNMSYRYLFCLEGAGSNPGDFEKTDCAEFIIKQLFDSEKKPGGIYFNGTINKFTHSRKLMDMYLCTDGLPVEVSPLFKGYAQPNDEFENRDYRMMSVTAYTDRENLELHTGVSGYPSMKFISSKIAFEESADYPVLRLPEVYLNLCEALWERDGDVDDATLNKTINIERARAGVKGLSSALVDQIKELTHTHKSHSEVLRDEIRRERTLELYMEGHRFNDLKRWGILETELKCDHLGTVVGGVGYPTRFRDGVGNNTNYYTPTAFSYGEGTISSQWGELNCIRLEKAENINILRAHYLWPLPSHQLQLNKNLVQNPGY